MQKEYSTRVAVVRDRGANEKTAVVCTTGGTTLGAAVGAGSNTALQYFGDPEIERVEIEVTAHCAVCRGAGEVRKARSRAMFARKRCPECKGVPCNDPPVVFAMYRPHGVLLLAMPVITAEDTCPCAQHRGPMGESPVGYAHAPGCRDVRTRRAG